MYGYGLGDQSLIPGRSKVVSLCHKVQRSLWAHTSSYQRVTEGSFSWVKWPEPESRAEIWNAWSFTFTFVWQCASQWPVAAAWRTRSQFWGGALWVPGAACADCGFTPTVRRQDVWVRPGSAAVLRTSNVPTQHLASLCAPWWHQFRGSHSICHRLGTFVWGWVSWKYHYTILYAQLAGVVIKNVPREGVTITSCNSSHKTWFHLVNLGLVCCYTMWICR
jgi:hypothetical protein